MSKEEDLQEARRMLKELTGKSFMKGYERTPEMTEKLIAAVSFALRANPTQRLGQLLINVSREELDQPNPDLWNRMDENWIALLKPPTIKEDNREDIK